MKAGKTLTHTTKVSNKDDSHIQYETHLTWIPWKEQLTAYLTSDHCEPLPLVYQRAEYQTTLVPASVIHINTKTLNLKHIAFGL